MAITVLVIDDDWRVRKILDLCLSREGFAVSTAESGRAGLKQFSLIRPDLVITDILMPDVEGIETIRTLKATMTPPIVIAISGGGSHVGHTFLRWAKHLGADAVLAKPFRPSALVALVEDLLNSAVEHPVQLSLFSPDDLPEPLQFDFSPLADPRARRVFSRVQLSLQTRWSR